MNEPRIAVVVPAYNAGKTIDECIGSLLGVGYPKGLLDIVFVDDGSTDDTVRRIAAHPEARLLMQEHKGPAAARNLGYRSSAADVIVFTDADCIVPSDWLARLAAELKSVDAVGGGLEPASLDTAAERFEQARRERLYGSARGFVDALPSCNLAFKRGVLDAVGGFDEDYRTASAEDYDLCSRVRAKGYSILYEPSLSVVHRHVTDWGSLSRKAYVHGREIMLYRRKVGKSAVAEAAKLVAKALALPLIIAGRYKLTMAWHGLRYEAYGLAGQTDGFIRYYAGAYGKH